MSLVYSIYMHRVHAYGASWACLLAKAAHTDMNAQALPGIDKKRQGDLKSAPSLARLIGRQQPISASANIPPAEAGSENQPVAAQTLTFEPPTPPTSRFIPGRPNQLQIDHLGPLASLAE